MNSNISKDNSGNQSISGRHQVSAKIQIPEKYLEPLSLAVLFCLPFYVIRFKSGLAAFNLVEVLIVIGFLVWIISRLREKKLSSAVFSHPFLKNNYYFSSIILILIGVGISAVDGGNYYISLGIIKGWFLLPLIFSFVLYDIVKKSENGIKKYFLAIFFSGALVSFLGVIYWLRGILTYDGRLALFFDSPNQLAMTLAPSFLIGIFFSLEKFSFGEPRRNVGGKKAELWNNGAIIFGSLLILLNLYLTKSYGAWLAIGLTLVAMFWLKYRKIWPQKYLFITIIILIIFVCAAGFGKFEDIKNLGSRSSLASRIIIWKSALLVGRDNPILGIGPGNFQKKYLEYQKYFPPYLEWSVPQPHSLFLAFWLEAGALGLIGFLLLIAKFFYDNMKLLKFTRKASADFFGGAESPEAGKEALTRRIDVRDFPRRGIKKASLQGREMALICFAVMLYFLLHGLVDTTYWKNDSAIIFWVVIAANAYLAQGNKLNNSG